MPGAALDLVFRKIERPKFCAGERYRLVKRLRISGSLAIFAAIRPRLVARQ